MISRFFNSTFESITGAALLLSAATLVSRLVGLLRDRLLAHAYGAGPVVDAYYAAFKIPDLFFNLLLLGAVTAGFIPTFTALHDRLLGKHEAWKLANTLINIIALAGAALAAAGFFAAPYLQPLIAPGFTGEAQALTVAFTRVLFLSPLLLGISMVAGGILQSLRRFMLYALAPVLYNLGIIVGIVAFVPLLGPIGLAWGVILGALLHAALQLYGAYGAGYRYRALLEISNPAVRQVGRLMPPRTAAGGISQFITVLITVLASLLPAGAVAIFNFANNLQGIALGAVAIPFAVAAFPLLSRAAARRDYGEFVTAVVGTLRQVLFLVAPLLILFILLRAQLVRVILGSGAFDWGATIATADALALLSVGLLAESLNQLFLRSFYALQDTITPLLTGLASASATALCALYFLSHPLELHVPLEISISGVPALALAVTAGSIINCILLFTLLRRKTGGLQEKNLATLLGQLAFAGLVMGLAMQTVKYFLASYLDLTRFLGVLLQGLGSGIIGLLLYGVVCYLIDVPELRAFYAGSLRKMRQLIGKLPPGMSETENL